ncbi:MAG: hypothetical protein PT965_02685 [Clostridia bacterium]|nr:hypothetical protein [Clostridia bacterium]MDY2930042.1 hypothetical protein [Clostridiaceae bacterium]
MHQKTRPRGRFGLSAAALLLCLALVAGTSYAWMQYTITSRGNQVRAADFDLDLSPGGGISFLYDWAPGQSNESNPVTLTNLGSVPALCRVSLSALSGDRELTQRLELWLEVTFPNKTQRNYTVTPGEGFSLVLPQKLEPGEQAVLVLRGSCKGFPAGTAVSDLWQRGLTLTGGTLTAELVQADGESYFAENPARP